MMKKFKKIKEVFKFKISILILSIFWGVAVLMFALTLTALGVWNPPTANPPGANAPTPLNVGTDGQTKAGGLTINAGGALSGVYVGNNAVIGYLGSGNYLDPSSPIIAPVDTSLILEGKLGIGTTSPANRLDVEGGVAIGDSYSGTSTAPASGLIVEGRVGLGTPSPSLSARLHVFGNTLIDTGILTLNSLLGCEGDKVLATNPSGDIYCDDDDGFAGVAPNYAEFVTLALDPTLTNERVLTAGSGIQISDGGANNPVTISLLAGVNGNTIRHNGTGWVSNSILYNNGSRVGIGTTSPANRLDVEGGVAIGDSYSGTSTAPTRGLIVEGRVGLGTPSPSLSARLEVFGNLLVNTGILTLNSLAGCSNPLITNGSGDVICGSATFAGYWSRTGTNTYLTNMGDNVGIGDTTPAEKLTVIGGGFLVGVDETWDRIKLSATTGVSTISGGDNRLDITTNNNAGFDIALLPGTGANVGIGTTNPGEKLQVDGNVRVKGRILAQTGLSTVPTYSFELDSDTGMSRSNTNELTLSAGGFSAIVASPTMVTIMGSGAGALTVGSSGAGKLTVGIIDPLYTIQGKKYATYVAAMIGQKEEHADLVQLSNYNYDSKTYDYVLDFKNAQEGSDLWLFGKVTNLETNFNQLSVLLTPSFSGDVWYEKDKENMRVVIYGEKEGEVSYRLSAPRFDFEKWTNYAKDVEGIDGFIIE